MESLPIQPPHFRFHLPLPRRSKPISTPSWAKRLHPAPNKKDTDVSANRRRRASASHTTPKGAQTSRPDQSGPRPVRRRASAPESARTARHSPYLEESDVATPARTNEIRRRSGPLSRRVSTTSSTATYRSGAEMSSVSTHEAVQLKRNRQRVEHDIDKLKNRIALLKVLVFHAI